MGWTDIAERMKPHVKELREFAESVWGEGFTDAVVLGMGGSSLGSLVLKDVFHEQARIRMHILDSTDPETVLALHQSLPLESTLFIVASKSGTTIEPKSFEDYFWSVAQQELGDAAGEHFVAITDPGSLMEAVSKERGYRKIWLGEPEIGGRFSVLSLFGLVSCALIGVDLDPFLDQAISVGKGFAGEISEHPGFALGNFFAEHGAAGRDKITILAEPGLESFGLWAEQLVAESTGKNDRGVLPIACEPLGSPEEYRKDRVFVVLTWADSVGTAAAQLGQQLAQLGHPVIERTLSSTHELAKEFLVWEVATAVCGIALQVNPFDQPNVQRAKEIARTKLDEIKKGQGALGTPTSRHGEASYFGANDLSEFLAGSKEGTYVALLGFVPESESTTQEFQRIRTEIRDRFGFVTSFGYGPRYLHSTGQYHKGGTDNGKFVIVISKDRRDADIPGAQATFGQLKRAQALGDLGALEDSNRKVLFIEISEPVTLSQLGV